MEKIKTTGTNFQVSNKLNTKAMYILYFDEKSEV